MQHGVPVLDKDDGFDRRSCGTIPHGWVGARGVASPDKNLLIQRIEHGQLRIVFVEKWQLEKCIRDAIFALRLSASRTGRLQANPLTSVVEQHRQHLTTTFFNFRLKAPNVG